MKKFIISLSVMLGVLGGFGGLALAGSPIDGARNQVCDGVQAQVGGSCNANAGNDVTRVLRVVLTILSWVAGIAAVIMIIVSGLKYITSGGDSSSISSAKQSLIYALVGLVIVAFAQVIVRFILSRTTAP